MKRRIFIFIALLLMAAGAVYAQSTATQILLGYVTTSGCPSGTSACWMPYSAANPMPITIVSR